MITNITVGSIFLSEYDMFKNFLAPGLSLLAALLAGLQTYLNFNKKASQHLAVGNAYSDIARKSRKLEAQMEDSAAINSERCWELLNELTDLYSKANKEAEGASLSQAQLNRAVKLTKKLDGAIKADSILCVTELILIRGLPGSGKSTLAKSFGQHIHFEADMYFEKSGKFAFDRVKLPDAHSWCLQRTSEELKKGNSVVVSNTFTRNVEMKPYFDLGYPVRVIEASGNWKSVHGVSDDHIGLMRNKWETLELVPTNEH